MDRSAVENTRSELLHQLRTVSVIRSEDEVLVSSKGETISWLIDTRLLLLRPDALRLIANLFWATMSDAPDFQLACLEMTGIPLLVGIQSHGLSLGRSINGLIVRKERKANGRLRAIEGQPNGLPVVLVDDILNSGESILKAFSVLKEHGLHISEVFTLVDFGRTTGKKRLDSISATGVSLFKIEELGISLSNAAWPSVPDVFIEEWSFRVAEPRYYNVVPKSTPAIDCENIYFGSDSGTLFAVRQHDGSVCWAFDTQRSTTKGIWSSPLLAGENVVFGAYDGNVYSVNRESGKLDWQFSEADWVGSSAALASDIGLIYIGLEHSLRQQAGSVIALEQSSGQRVWEFPTLKYVHGSPRYIESKKLVVVGTNDNECLCLEAQSGELVWLFGTSGPVKSRPAYASDMSLIIFGCFDHHVYAVSIATGEIAWRVRTEGIVYSEPLILGEKAFVTSTDKHLYVIDVSTGEILHKWNAGAKVFSSPTHINGKIYFGTTGGVMYEYDPNTFTATGRHQLPERITNSIVQGQNQSLLFVSTNDNQILALRKPESASKSIES